MKYVSAAVGRVLIGLSSGQPLEGLSGSLAPGVPGHHVSVLPASLVLDRRVRRSCGHHPSGHADPTAVPGEVFAQARGFGWFLPFWIVMRDVPSGQNSTSFHRSGPRLPSVSNRHRPSLRRLPGRWCPGPVLRPLTPCFPHGRAEEGRQSPGSVPGPGR